MISFILASLLLSLSAVQAEDAALEAVFPRRKLLVKYAEPSSAQSRVIDQVLTNTLRVAQAVSASPEERAAFLRAGEELRRSGRWVCRDSCVCAKEALGCEKLEQRSDWIGGIIVLDPCLVSSARCAKRVVSKSAEISAILEQALLARVARRRALDQKRWTVQFAATRKTIESLLSRCGTRLDQRAYSLSQAEFALLIRNGLRKLSDASWSTCGISLVKELRSLESLPACRTWTNSSRWGFWGADLQREYYRCEGNCLFLTCEKSEQARVFSASGVLGLVLPEGRCEGTKPIQTYASLVELLRQVGTDSGTNYCLMNSGLTIPVAPRKGGEPKNTGPDVDIIQ